MGRHVSVRRPPGDRGSRVCAQDQLPDSHTPSGSASLPRPSPHWGFICRYHTTSGVCCLRCMHFLACVPTMCQLPSSCSFSVILGSSTPTWPGWQVGKLRLWPDYSHLRCSLAFGASTGGRAAGFPVGATLTQSCPRPVPCLLLHHSVPFLPRGPLGASVRSELPLARPARAWQPSRPR